MLKESCNRTPLRTFLGIANPTMRFWKLKNSPRATKKSKVSTRWMTGGSLPPHPA